MTHSISQNIKLCVASENDILNVTLFKYSLHKFR